MKLITEGLGKSQKIITEGLGRHFAAEAVEPTAVGGFFFLHAKQGRKVSGAVEVLGVSAKAHVGSVSVSVGVQVQPEGIFAKTATGKVSVSVEHAVKVLGQQATIRIGSVQASARDRIKEEDEMLLTFLMAINSD